MNVFKHKIQAKILAFFAIVLTIFMVLSPVLVFASTTFQGGNMFLVSNTNFPAWTDPVAANVGDIVEFHLEINNTGAETAKNIKVRADLPSGVTNGPLVTTIHVTADNASEMTDTATVNVAPNCNNQSQCASRSLVYFPGHATLIRHPGNINTSIEPIGSGSNVAIGDLDVGNSFFLEVLFKAQVVEAAAPTATPTPTGVPTNTPTPTPTGLPTTTLTPTATPTPTGTITPTMTPTITPTGTITPTPTSALSNIVSCPEGFIQTISGSNIICIQQIQNQSQTNSSSSSSNASTGEINVSTGPVNVTNQTTTNVPAPVPITQTSTTTQVTQLPKTGLPLAAWAMSGLLPVGFGIKKLGSKQENNLNESPFYLSQRRKFTKDS